MTDTAIATNNNHVTDCDCFECQEAVAQTVDAIINEQEPHELSIPVFQQVE